MSTTGASDRDTRPQTVSTTATEGASFQRAFTLTLGQPQATAEVIHERQVIPTTRTSGIISGRVVPAGRMDPQGSNTP